MDDVALRQIIDCILLFKYRYLGSFPSDCVSMLPNDTFAMMANVSFGSIETQSEGNEPRYRYLKRRIQSIICRNATSSILGIFTDNAKPVDCNRRHSFPQFNDFCFTFERFIEVEFQSQWFANQFRIVVVFSSVLQ